MMVSHDHFLFLLRTCIAIQMITLEDKEVPTGVITQQQQEQEHAVPASIEDLIPQQSFKGLHMSIVFLLLELHTNTMHHPPKQQQQQLLQNSSSSALGLGLTTLKCLSALCMLRFEKCLLSPYHKMFTMMK